jgi:hypothetical protein
MTDETASTDTTDIPDLNVDELLGWVAEDPEVRGPLVLAAELERDRPRKGIVEVLTPADETASTDTTDVRTPADAEAELVAELVKTGDDRDQARIDELLAELGPPPGPAGPTEAVPAPPVSAGPQADGPIVVTLTSDSKVGDVVITGGVGYEIVSGADGTTVKVDETGAITEIL